jgi:hypothetical protein
MSRSRNGDYDDSFSESGASASTNTSFSQADSDTMEDGRPRSRRRRDTDADRHIWTGDVSSVIGLQKRGLRGLMEGRRMRERSGGKSGVPAAPASAASVEAQ